MQLTPIASNMTEVETSEARILFSYRTPVAAYIFGEGYVKTDQLSIDGDYQPDLYYYWDSPLEEDYDWRSARPNVDCLCEICFDILNKEGKISWCDS